MAVWKVTCECGSICDVTPEDADTETHARQQASIKFSQEYDCQAETITAELFDFRGFMQGEREPLTSHLAAHLFTCLNIERQNKVEEQTIIIDELNDDFLFRVMGKRLAYHRPDLTIAPAALFFVRGAMDSPGEAVLWAYTLHRFAIEHDRSHISLHDFVGLGVPNGFPVSEGARQRLWLSQKIGGSNAVDREELWSKQIPRPVVPLKEETDE